jgi:signal transduction histidine kinase/CheY-like chemotaxis protein
MPFGLLNQEYQNRISISHRLAPLVIFFAGTGLTVLLAMSFYDAEKKNQSDQLVAASRESFKIQNLILMNSLLKLQSFSEMADQPLTQSLQSRLALRQLLVSSDFKEVSFVTVNPGSAKATEKIRMNADSAKFLDKPVSDFLSRKLHLIDENNVSHSISLNFDGGKATINSIWQSRSKKNQYLVFSSPIEHFLKDWPEEPGLVMKLRDRHSKLQLLLHKSNASGKKLLITLDNDGPAASKTFVPVYHNSLVSDYYGIDSDWYRQDSIPASTYVYSIIACGFLISLMVSLFARFILQKNRDIYRLVIARTEELESAMIQAKEANRAKTRFLANMSHELRTPLNLILGMLEVMQGRTLDDKEKKYIVSMQGAGRHLLNLITDLLTMAKDDVTEIPVQKTSFNAYNFFDDIAAIVRPECKNKNLEMALDFSSEIPVLISGDAVKTRQILLNLIRNSLKYTFKGKITLKAELIKFAGEGKARSCHLRLTVSDTGFGIPEDKMNLLFDRLYHLDTTSGDALQSTADGTVNPIAGGSIGLSLSIVRDLVLKLNGNINVKSQVGKGTDFIIDLDFDVPFKSEDLEKETTVELDQISKEKSEFENGLQPEELRILVVDDDAGNRELMLAYLDEPHFKVQLAENGAEAFEMYKTQRPDLIIADLRMPVMNGFQLAEAINDFEQKDNFESVVPFVLLTADALEETLEEAKKFPISVFLTKPVRKRKVIEVINDLRSRKLVGQNSIRIQQAV